MQTKNNIFFIIAVFTLLVSCKKNTEKATPPPNPPIQKEHLDISYATGSNAQKLDIFLPDTIKSKNPVLVWIHGGGWKGGDKSEFRNSNRLTELKKRGYAVVVINYRLSGEAKFPAQIYDVKAAIRWIKANAATYNFNADKVGVWGSSAGGHLSALAGTSGNVAALEDLTQGNSSLSSTVQAVIDWYGPTDFLKMDSLALLQGCASSAHNAATSPESELIGFQITTRPDLVAKANPITYISNDDPPFFIEHGLTDCTVAYGQSQLLYDQLVPVLGAQKVKIKLLAATGHGGGLFSDFVTVKEAIDFLDTYLK
jgi:acetyl esterase/lipase